MNPVDLIWLVILSCWLVFVSFVVWLQGAAGHEEREKLKELQWIERDVRTRLTIAETELSLLRRKVQQ